MSLRQKGIIAFLSGETRVGPLSDLFCIKSLPENRVYSTGQQCDSRNERMDAASMKTDFVLGFEYACYLWRRADLESAPCNIHRVAQILAEAGIQVFEVNPEGWLRCEPRPLGVREALTGEFTDHYLCGPDYPPEIPGLVLKKIADQGIPVTTIL